MSDSARLFYYGPVLREQFRTIFVSGSILLLFVMFSKRNTPVTILETHFSGLTPEVVVVACCAINVYMLFSIFCQRKLEVLAAELGAFDQELAALRVARSFEPGDARLKGLLQDLETGRSRLAEEIDRNRPIFRAFFLFVPVGYGVLTCLSAVVYLLWPNLAVISR